MGRGNLTYALALACVLTACSGGGEEGQAFDTGAEGLLGAVQLLEHWPADDATQVELGLDGLDQALRGARQQHPHVRRLGLFENPSERRQRVFPRRTEAEDDTDLTHVAITL